MPQSGSSHQPLVKGEVYDRPEYPDLVLRTLDEYRMSRLLFIDAFKDASRHDQAQLFDSMVGRFQDFLGKAMAEIANEGEVAVKLASRDVLGLSLNEGGYEAREEKMLQATNYLERLLIEYGYFIAKRKAVVVAANLTE